MPEVFHRLGKPGSQNPAHRTGHYLPVVDWWLSRASFLSLRRIQQQIRCSLEVQWWCTLQADLSQRSYWDLSGAPIIPSGKRPMLLLCACFPRYHPSPKSSSRSISSIRSPLDRLNSSGLRASKSSACRVTYRQPRVFFFLVELSDEEPGARSHCNCGSYRYPKRGLRCIT